MQTVEIPRTDWSRVLNEISVTHRGWLVSLDLQDPGFGTRPEIQKLPLLGVTAEPVHGTDITIAAARSDEDHVTHTIQSPARVRLKRTDRGTDLGLEIESAQGTVAILRFVTVTPPL